MIDLNKLKELAEQATPGPWEQGTKDMERFHVYSDDALGTSIVECASQYNSMGGAQRLKNLAYIEGAQPRNILELIAALEHLTTTNQSLMAEVELLRLQLSNSHLKVGAPIRCTISAAEGESKFYSGELTDEKRRQVMGKPALHAEEVSYEQ